MQTLTEFVNAFAANDANFEGTGPTPPTPAPDPVTDERDGAAAAPASGSDAGDTAADDAGDEGAGDREGTADAAADSGAGDPDADATGDASDDDETDGDEDGDQEAKELLGKHVPTTLDDLPAEARPIVEKRLREIERGVTRAFQEARSYRADEAKFRAEEKFRTEHPHLVILEMIEKDPALLDKVNGELDKLEQTPGYKDVQTHQRTQAREAATKAITDEQADRDARRSRGEEVHAYVATSIAKSGIPMALVEDAVVNLIVTRRNAGADVTNADLDRVIGEKVAVWKRTVDGRRRENRQQATRDKAKDARTAGPKVKPGTGQAPTPARKPPAPKTLEEGLRGTVDRLFPGEL